MSLRSGLCCVLALVVCVSAAAQAGDGVVALQTADPACPDDSSNRYVDCGNGTVTDNLTGLVWLANASCWKNQFTEAAVLDWHEAMVAVAGLSDLECDPEPGDCDCGLSDGSSPGEWRLPSKDEWKAMMADETLSCDPAITTDSGTECWTDSCGDCAAPSTRAVLCPCSFYGVKGSHYWSSSLVPPDTLSAWSARLQSGSVVHAGKNLNDDYVWPVRGGQ